MGFEDAADLNVGFQPVGLYRVLFLDEPLKVARAGFSSSAVG